MSLKLPIKIRKKSIANILDYFRNNGYSITIKGNSSGNTTYFTNCPGWGDLTPIIETYEGYKTPIQCWFYIRIPNAYDEAILKEFSRGLT